MEKKLSWGVKMNEDVLKKYNELKGLAGFYGCVGRDFEKLSEILTDMRFEVELLRYKNSELERKMDELMKKKVKKN